MGQGNSFQGALPWVGGPTRRDLSRDEAVRRNRSRDTLLQEHSKATLARVHTPCTFCVRRFHTLSGASRKVSGVRGDTFQKEKRKSQEPKGLKSLQRVLLLHRCWPLQVIRTSGRRWGGGGETGRT